LSKFNCLFKDHRKKVRERYDFRAPVPRTKQDQASPKERATRIHLGKTRFYWVWKDPRNSARRVILSLSGGGTCLVFPGRHIGPQAPWVSSGHGGAGARVKGLSISCHLETTGKGAEKDKRLNNITPRTVPQRGRRGDIKIRNNSEKGASVDFILLRRSKTQQHN